ncbi:MAG: 50S ribosomal protein L11 methyltransferase [Oscillospiraceae bacterium]|nr:50S ribosomal protein L11 methyltransferase [Oscillospiraceae bacterium]
MEWLELTIKTASEGVELTAAALTLWGYDSFVIDDQTEFQDFLEHNRDYWDYVDEELAQKMEGLSQIRLYLEDGPEAPEQVAQLRTQLAALKAEWPAVNFGSLEVSLCGVREEDWENSWKQYYQPIRIGERLLVVPKWLSPENEEGRIPVLLDPGMIFGTGNHASTRMCMKELETLVHGGERVLDLGSGSGILSITAILLGAASAIGVDIDPKAESIACENAAFNGIGSDRFTALTGNVIADSNFTASLRGESGCELVLANIVADVIIPLAPVVPALLKQDGRFICSGVLYTRLDEVLAALDAAGLQVLAVHQEDDWCQLTAKRKED